jgi:hypothetical protein
MMDYDELSIIKGRQVKTSEDTNETMSLEEEQLLFTDTTIVELRNLLSFVKGYKQIINVKHPEVKTFEHWDEMDADIDAMADRLSTYERLLHATKTNAYA